MLGDDGKLICKEARIENTNLCNTSCVFCPREKMTRAKTTIPMDLFVNLADQVCGLGVTDLSIFGYGEPLIDKDLERKIAYANSLGLITHVTTNGYLLDWKRMHGLLDAGLKHLRFSIHATVPVKYQKIHGMDWLQTWRNFGNFVSYNKHTGHRCTVHLSAMPMNGETVQEIRDTWEKWVDYLEIWRPHNWAGGREYRSLGERRKTCGRPFLGPVQILATGELIVCCFDFDGKLVIGDARTAPLSTILRGNRLGSIKLAHLSGMHGGLICGDCDQLNVEPGEVLLYSNRDKERKLDTLSTSKACVCKN